MTTPANTGRALWSSRPLASCEGGTFSSFPAQTNCRIMDQMTCSDSQEGTQSSPPSPSASLGQRTRKEWGGGSDGMSHRRDFFGEALRHSGKNFGGRLDLNLSCCLQVVTLAGDSSSKPPFFSMQNGVNSCSLKLSGTQLSNKQDPL